MIQTLFGSTEQKPSFFERMKEAVTRTRENLSERIEEVVSIGKEIDRSTLDDLEATLIGADLGSKTTHEVLEKLRDKADRKQIKNIDELTLLNMAAAMVDGVYQDIAEALKPGVKESEIVALATGRLYGMGSDCVEAINSISGERCSPHPHNFTDRLIRPGDTVVVEDPGNRAD